MVLVFVNSLSIVWINCLVVLCWLFGVALIVWVTALCLRFAGALVLVVWLQSFVFCAPIMSCGLLIVFVCLLWLWFSCCCLLASGCLVCL